MGDEKKGLQKVNSQPLGAKIEVVGPVIVTNRAKWIYFSATDVTDCAWFEAR